MYLIYFYSHISNEIIPKLVVMSTNEIDNTINKIIYDIIVFEEGKKKADMLYIFKEDEKVLFDGLDDGIYVKKSCNKYLLNKKMTKHTLYNGWFSSVNQVEYENSEIGYVSFLQIPILNKPDVLDIPKNDTSISNRGIKDQQQIIDNKVHTNMNSDDGFDSVISELKKKFKLKNA